MRLIKAINAKRFKLNDLRRKKVNHCFLCETHEDVVDFLTKLIAVGYTKWFTSVDININEPASPSYNKDRHVPICYFVHYDGLSYSYNINNYKYTKWSTDMIIEGGVK